MIERGYPKLTIQLCKRFNHVHTVEAVIIPNLRSLIRSFNFEHYTVSKQKVNDLVKAYHVSIELVKRWKTAHWNAKGCYH